MIRQMVKLTCSLAVRGSLPHQRHLARDCSSARGLLTANMQNIINILIRHRSSISIKEPIRPIRATIHGEPLSWQVGSLEARCSLRATDRRSLIGLGAVGELVGVVGRC